MNQADGTITSIDTDPNSPINEGATLFTVDLRPTVAGVGATPSFRALARGAKGQDVKQLQSLLFSLGFYEGSLDGGFGAATEAAVRRWQSTTSVAEDGIV
ncbi:peptidoglycan-binding protein [Leifsonia sp. NPDC058248]|uniref:peptidoglycan-binding domain-containing protein n=1 Tax=Leifsonia sp. NPDC058248 TaxID=3346402 RepID=UPI0036D94E26